MTIKIVLEYRQAEDELAPDELGDFIRDYMECNFPGDKVNIISAEEVEE